MIWSSFAEFIDMGGYGLYVWGSYVMTAAALGWEALGLAHRRHRALDELDELAAQRASRSRAKHAA